jgi:hypothetical protein
MGVPDLSKHNEIVVFRVRPANVDGMRVHVLYSR